MRTDYTAGKSRGAFKHIALADYATHKADKTGHEVNMTMLTLKKNTLSTQATGRCVSNRPGDWSLIPLEENTLQLMRQSNTQCQY